MPISQTVKFHQEPDFFNASSKDLVQTINFDRSEKMSSGELIRNLCKNSGINQPTRFKISTKKLSTLHDFDKNFFNNLNYPMVDDHKFIFENNTLKVVHGTSLFQVLNFDPCQDVFTGVMPSDLLWWMTDIEVVAEPISQQSSTTITIAFPDASSVNMLVTPATRVVDVADAVTAHMVIERSRLLDLIRVSAQSQAAIPPSAPSTVLNFVSAVAAVASSQYVVVATDPSLGVNRSWNIAIDASTATVGDLKRAITAETGISSIFMTLNAGDQVVDMSGSGNYKRLSDEHIVNGCTVVLNIVTDSK